MWSNLPSWFLWKLKTHLSNPKALEEVCDKIDNSVVELAYLDVQIELKTRDEFEDLLTFLELFDEEN